jgi:hypothetical protein
MGTSPGASHSVCVDTSRGPTVRKMATFLLWLRRMRLEPLLQYAGLLVWRED